MHTHARTFAHLARLMALEGKRAGLPKRLDGEGPVRDDYRIIAGVRQGGPLMAANGLKKVTVEIDAEVLAKLDGATRALSGLASAYIHGCDDPRVHARSTAPKGNAKSAR
jgi:hypothetical protein